MSCLLRPTPQNPHAPHGPRTWTSHAAPCTRFDRFAGSRRVRDDQEAQRHRIDALERSLAHARREHAELLATAGEAVETERERERLAVEVTRLRAKVFRARATRTAWIARGITVALLGVGLSYVWADGEHRALDAQRSLDSAALDTAAARMATESATRCEALDVRAHEAESRATAAETRERLAAQRADDIGQRFTALAAVTPSAHVFPAWSSIARVVDAEGQDLDGPCEVRVRGEGIQCYARVVCGSTELYPHPGTSGRLGSCASNPRGPTVAQDVEVTEADGDPTFDLDVLAGTAVVADRAWRVELELVVAP